MEHSKQLELQVFNNGAVTLAGFERSRMGEDNGVVQLLVALSKERPSSHRTSHSSVPIRYNRVGSGRTCCKNAPQTSDRRRHGKKQYTRAAATSVPSTLANSYIRRTRNNLKGCMPTQQLHSCKSGLKVAANNASAAATWRLLLPQATCWPASSKRRCAAARQP